MFQATKLGAARTLASVVVSVLLVARFFATCEEKQILRCAQDDMSFRAKRSGARNLPLVAAVSRPVVPASRRPATEVSEDSGDDNVALKVSDNGRYFVQHGKPFFWLGDSTWSLFVLYSTREAEEYLEHRRQQGFNVFHVMLAFNGGPGLKTGAGNQEGEMPWLDSNPAHPNEAYFKNVDYIVDMARRKGLIMYLLPLGGSGGAFVEQEKVFTSDNVRAYAKWLGHRYRNVPNIVWMNGFDLAPWEHVEFARDLAAGLREGGAAQLMSYAPRGGLSSSYFQQEAWLGFNHIQTWSDYWRAHSMVLADYCRLPIKPVVMAEGAYEEGPEYPSRPITPLVVRKEAYWSFLGGGFHSYGHNDIWRHNPSWRKSLDSPGARQMGILKAIFTSHNWWKLVPDQSVFRNGAGSDMTLNVAARSTDGDGVIVYLSSPCSVSVDMSKVTASKTIQATWVNPATGANTPIGDLPNQGFHSFTTPNPWEDALLLLDAVKDAKRPKVL
jgi:hypothetical protein